METIIKVLKRILGLLENYRWWIFGVIYLFGVGVYMFVCHAGLLASVHSAGALFALSVNTNFPDATAGHTTWVYAAGLLAAFYTVISVISLVAKKFIDKQSVIEATKESYILVCGLGKKASAYIESELDDDKNVKIIAIEKDAQNPNIEKYRAKGIAVEVADAKDADVLSALSVANTRHIVVLAGKDTDNLEIALALRAVFRKDDLAVRKLYMHIDDRGLDKFYKDGGLLDDSAKLEVKMFSMSRNGAKALFLKYAIDGDSRTYIDSDKPFSLVVAGYSKLAIEVIGQICELAHLPNENEVTIYCIDKDIETFKKVVEYRYQSIDDIPNIKLEYISLDDESQSFYTDGVWGNEITNIMLCYDDAQTNLDIAAELGDSTYLQEIIAKSLDRIIHIAIYDSKMLAQNIIDNEEHFKYYDVFAQTSQMASREMIVDEKFEMIAKCIHAGYEERYNKDAMFGDTASIDEAWYDKDMLINRESNHAQAYHIPMKLKALGLKRCKSEKGQAELLMQNRSFLIEGDFAKELKTLGLDADALEVITKEYVGDGKWDKIPTFSYFPKEYKLLIEKLIRSEHNRWNAHHYLKGWDHNKDKANKPIKQHRCLITMAQMDDRDKYTCLYDIYSVLYIPNLLAKVGYEIVEEESKDA